MMNRIFDQAYVLDSKAYRETSALIKFFSKQSGICSGVLRQVYQKTKRAQQQRSLLQLGNELSLEYACSGELKTIYAIDSISALSVLNTKQYVLVSYLNELLLALLPQNTPNEHLYQVYHNTLLAIEHRPEDERSLRYFEFHLLNEMGFVFDWLHCYKTGAMIHKDEYYHFDAQNGFAMIDKNKSGLMEIHGADIVAIHRGDFATEGRIHYAKRIFRRLIQGQLGSRELKTRQLYLEMFVY